MHTGGDVRWLARFLVQSFANTTFAAFVAGVLGAVSLSADEAFLPGGNRATYRVERRHHQNRQRLAKKDVDDYSDACGRYPAPARWNDSSNAKCKHRCEKMA